MKKSLILILCAPFLLTFISCETVDDQLVKSPVSASAVQNAGEPKESAGIANGNINVPIVPPLGPVSLPSLPFAPMMGFPEVVVSNQHGHDDDKHQGDHFCSDDTECPRDFVCVNNFCHAPCELVSISISVANKSAIAVGTNLQLIAIGTFIDGSSRDITSSVLWSSFNTDVATVSNAPGSNGFVAALAVGVTKITAALGALSANLPLTVTNAVLVSIEVTPNNPSIPKGTTQQFTATGIFSDGTTEDISTQVTWSSSMLSVASISNASGTKGLATGLSLGSSVITATLSALSGDTSLNVTAAALVSIAVTPANPSLAAGATQQFIATGTFSDGTTQNLTSSVTWASSNNTIATISNLAGSNGLATAVSPGSTSISATEGAITVSTILTVANNLYAILDSGPVGSIIHNVVSIDYSDPNNINYVPFGTIAGFADKYFVSATLDSVSGKIFFALSDSDSTTSVNNIYLYSVTFPDLSAITPFSINNTVYINLNPQVTYNVADSLFYYAINNDPLGYDYKVNTIDSNGTINITTTNTSNIQNSSNGLQIFNNYLYASYRPGNSFIVYYAGINNNTTGSISSPITPQPPGQIWSVFDLNGVLWGTTQVAASSPPSYSLYKLQCTSGGLPANDPFPSELVGNMPTTFESNPIANLTLFTPTI